MLPTARALHAALEAGHHGEALRPLFTPDAVVVTHPNLVSPRGHTSDVDGLVASSTAGARLLAGQTYAVRDAIVHEDTVVVRVTWRATVAADAGPYRAGQALTAEVAQFFTIRDGRIARLETFDCFAPLGG